MSIITNPERIGCFTSSEIWKLVEGKETFTKGGLTYIEQKQREKKLFRSIKNEVSSRELEWGKYLEKRAFKKLDFSYRLLSDITVRHPKIPNWSGSTDGIKYAEDGSKEKVFNIKCPFTLESFCDLVDWGSGIEAMYKIMERHTSGKHYYWQLVSDAILNDCKIGELIVYVPKQVELIDIRMGVKYEDETVSKRLEWLTYSEDEQLPYLHQLSKYESLNIIEFEIPEKDINHLTNRVLLANKYLES